MTEPTNKRLMPPEAWGWLRATARLMQINFPNPVTASEKAITHYAEQFPESVGLECWGQNQDPEAQYGSDPVCAPVLVALAEATHGSVPTHNVWSAAGYDADFAEFVSEDPIETTFIVRYVVFTELGWKDA